MMGVKHGLPLWQVYAMIPLAARAVVQRWVSAMATGMSNLGEPHDRPFFVSAQGNRRARD